MERYYVYTFDVETFIVADSVTNKEVCVCGDFDDTTDAENRAEKIAAAMNYFTVPPAMAYDASLKCMELFNQKSK